MGTRRNFSAEFKAKVALEALVGSHRRWRSWRPSMNPNVIVQSRLRDQVFAKKTSRGAADREAEVKTLHAKIGQTYRGERSLYRKPLLVEKGMVEEDHPRLSIVRQCELVSISRSSHSTRARVRAP